MSAIDVTISTHSAMARIITVLRAKLTEEIDALCTALGVPVINVPSPVEYFSAWSADNLETISQGSGPVTCMVFQAGAQEPVEFMDGSEPDYYHAIMETDFGITFAFNLANFEPFTYNGKTINTQEMLALRGVIYANAALQVINKYSAVATVDDGLTSVILVERLPVGVYTNDEEITLGIAELVVMAQQHVKIHAPITGVI
jgi:hypothetical protein